MKKILSTATAILLAVSLSATALAATWEPNPGANGDVSNGTQDVPMFGYIGEGFDPTDPDPEGPTNPFTSLNLSVPVKFLWAAFHDGTNPATAPVESPSYQIINNSTSDVEISVTDFVVETALAPADGSVDLTFTGGSIPAIALNGISASFPASLGTIEGTDSSGTTGSTDIGETWTFTVAGTYTPSAGAWPTDIATPEYTVEFNFALRLD